MNRTALLPALLLGACVTGATAPGGDPYGALGTEPFWSVEIANGRIGYDSANGGAFSVPAPPPRMIANGRRYETDRITVEITRSDECSDGMSDRVYADEVTVILAGETLRGCGGAILPPESLADTGWAIIAIDGQAVRGENDDNYVIQFQSDRLSGRAGCNRFSGTYTRNGNRLMIGPLMSTRMACPEPAMGHERRAMQVLSGPVTIEFPRGEILVITGNSGSIRLERSI